MKNMWQVYAVLRRKNIKNYFLLFVCCFISVLLITSFSVIMQSRTVQMMLPEGGDSRKQMTMVFTLAIVGCAVFTGYASTLFFRSKSRETGICMALGVKKRALSGLLCRELALISALSAAAGLLLGLPLAVGIWQLFRLLVVDSKEMAFRIDFSGFLWPLAFWAFSAVMLFCMGWRFIRRSNILDIINEQRKSEPVRDVKGWYGIAGGALMVLGGGGAALLPGVLAGVGFVTPAWAISLLYIAAAVGLYLLLVFIVVRGFGGKKSYYKNIITRSMMKFQGRQTVLNMCVITVLVMAAYFSMFYTPMLLGTSIIGFKNRPVDNAFHYRADEQGIPNREEIERIAAEEGVALKDYREVEFANLATDGYDREWTQDGRFGNEYHEFYREGSFLSQLAFETITGIQAQVPPGGFVYVTRVGYIPSPYDYFVDMKRFTNPDTQKTLSVTFSGELHFDMPYNFIVLNNEDYAAITEGLTDEWRENWVQFDVDNVDETYAFANRLKNAIIDGSSEKSAMYENYDRIERQNAHAAGQEYPGDTDPDRQARYEERGSYQFIQYWRYIPMFRVLDIQDFVATMAVFLMLFVFMAIICMAAVIVIAYTRCLTIASANLQVYDDLRRLGARRDYLFRALRGQVARVFLIPLAIGTVGILGFFFLLMYSNNGALDEGELVSIGMSAALTAVASGVMWGVYRVTLKRARRMLGV